MGGAKRGDGGRNGGWHEERCRLDAVMLSGPQADGALLSRTVSTVGVQVQACAVY